MQNKRSKTLVVGLLLISFLSLGVSSCGSNPKAPNIEICTLFSPQDMHCTFTESTEERELTIGEDQIGWRATSFEDYSAVEEYHKKLRLELKKCRDGK